MVALVEQLVKSLSLLAVLVTYHKRVLLPSFSLLGVVPGVRREISIGEEPQKVCQL